MNLNGKTVNLAQLDAEMTAAGISHRRLGSDGTSLYTYDDDGVEVDDLPSGAQAVIDAHVPTPILTRDEVLYETLGEAKAALDAAQTPDEKLAAFSQGLAAIQSIFGAP